MRFARGTLLSLVAMLLASVVLAWPAGGQERAPSLVLDRDSVAIGDKVLVTLQGFPVQEAVSISLCGNGAARGSVDCDLTNSLGYGVSAASPVHRVLFRVTTPPRPCPCVIVVANSVQTKTAMAPLNLVGHPTAPVIGNRFRPPLSLDISARRADQGLLATLKSSLGGPTTYELTVVLRNMTAGDLPGVRLTARAGRGADDQARLIRIKGPDVLGPNQTWTHEQKVSLAAPVVGRFVWKVSASGAGPVVRSETTTRHVPLLLMLLIVVLAADLAAIVGRRIQRRRDQARAEQPPAEDQSLDGAADDPAELVDTSLESERERVGVAGPSAH